MAVRDQSRLRRPLHTNVPEIRLPSNRGGKRAGRHGSLSTASPPKSASYASPDSSPCSSSHASSDPEPCVLCGVVLTDGVERRYKNLQVGEERGTETWVCERIDP
jgi:hypothetical protein